MAGVRRGAAGGGSPRQRPAHGGSPHTASHSAGDALRAAFYAVQMMSEDAARRRFTELVAKEYMLTDEADECQMLADRLKARLAWSHFDLRAGEWREGRGRAD